MAKVMKICICVTIAEVPKVRCRLCTDHIPNTGGLNVERSERYQRVFEFIVVVIVYCCYPRNAFVAGDSFVSFSLFT